MITVGLRGQDHAFCFARAGRQRGRSADHEAWAARCPAHSRRCRRSQRGQSRHRRNEARESGAEAARSVGEEIAGEWPRVTAFVLDVSVTMAWCFKDEASDDTWALLDRLTADTAIVPGIWSAEVANVLLVAERRQRIDTADARTFIARLMALPIVVRKHGQDAWRGPVDRPRNAPCRLRRTLSRPRHPARHAVRDHRSCAADGRPKDARCGPAGLMIRGNG